MTESRTVSSLARLDDEKCWQAVLNRDAAADDSFLFGVLTTGIYCRPSCPARRPKRANVRFFESSDAAKAAGLRACLRCLPDSDSKKDVVRRLTLLLKSESGSIPFSQLAGDLGFSAGHLQKLFKQATGMTPAAFVRALRRGRLANSLSECGSVTAAFYDAGYSAPSRFYEENAGRLGMLPSVWRNGGHGETIHWSVVSTTLGSMLVAATRKGVCRLSFNEDRTALEQRFPKATLIEGGAEFASLLADVIASVEMPALKRNIPIDVQGTAFQEAVWQALCQIPAGETRSYAQIAAAIGKPKAVRATGSANGANPVAVLVPCHRVVRSDGSPGGYAYGLAIKRELLARETDKGQAPVISAKAL